MNRLLMLFAAMFAFAAVPVLAQSERPYTEGSVIEVTSVRVKDGQWDTYLSYLKASYKPVLEEQKKAGIVLDYSIYATAARRPDEPNLYLTVVYPNMASFDGLEDKVEPLARKVTGQDRSQADKAYADRSTMREILGTELIRELELK
jgi:hypothetical protein